MKPQATLEEIRAMRSTSHYASIRLCGESGPGGVEWTVPVKIADITDAAGHISRKLLAMRISISTPEDRRPWPYEFVDGATELDVDIKTGQAIGPMRFIPREEDE
jgi:hypothetical protein